MFERTDLCIEKDKEKENVKIIKKSDGITVFKGENKEDKHITISFQNIMTMTDHSELEKEIELSLKSLMPKVDGNVMVVGLGNTEITPDAIGPFTAEKILATRHLMGNFAKNIGLESLKSVSVISPNVLGKTGIESAEIIKSVAEKIKPQAVIAVDALCSLDVNRLFSTIQLSNMGISPGSGVKNSRKALNKETLGVPVVAVGIPTVAELKNSDGEMIVTAKDADILCKNLSEILSRSINTFLQPETDPEIIFALV